MKTKSLQYILYTLLLVALMHSCSVSVAGGGSDTEVGSRKVAGAVLDSVGNPVAGVTIRLRPAAYITDSLYSNSYTSRHTLAETVSATDGSFKFDSLLADNYCIDCALSDSLGAIQWFTLSDNQTELRLPTVNLESMAIIDGNAKIYGVDSATCFLQIVGTEYKIQPDTMGYFMLRVPHGKHTMHFGAYTTNDTMRIKPVDQFDLLLEIHENYKNLGEFKLEPPPPNQCTDFYCDSIVMRKALDEMLLYNIDVKSVCTVENNRIVSINLRRIPFYRLSAEVMGLTELRSIDLGLTGIADLLPSIGEIQKLESIKLDSNRITYLPSSIVLLSGLKVLDIKNNLIKDMPRNFDRLRPSVLLDLSNNKFCKPDSVFVKWADRYDPDWRSTQNCP